MYYTGPWVYVPTDRGRWGLRRGRLRPDPRGQNTIRSVHTSTASDQSADGKPQKVVQARRYTGNYNLPRSLGGTRPAT